MAVRAVLFDVDFTLIHPGPTFSPAGYQAFCTRYGISVDPSTFAAALADAVPLLDAEGDARHDDEIFVAFTRSIIEGMGGSGERVDACAREIYAEWAGCQHFMLYPDALPALREVASLGLQIGLISNSHRCMTSFQSHFELQGLIACALSSSQHGYVKPHRSIFDAALRLLDVPAANAVMVGDSPRHDIEGALGAGMNAVLLHRSTEPHPREEALAAAGVPTLRSLSELPGLLESAFGTPNPQCTTLNRTG